MLHHDRKGPGVGIYIVADMSTRRLSQRSNGTDSAQAAQLSLEIGPPTAPPRAGRSERRAPVGKSQERDLALDQIVAMRDVIKITGKHRCTIHRWMLAGIFPRKAIQSGRTIGWRRSDIERWLEGDEGREEGASLRQRGTSAFRR